MGISGNGGDDVVGVGVRGGGKDLILASLEGAFAEFFKVAVVVMMIVVVILRDCNSGGSIGG